MNMYRLHITSSDILRAHFRYCILICILGTQVFRIQYVVTVLTALIHVFSLGHFSIQLLIKFSTKDKISNVVHNLEYGAVASEASTEVIQVNFLFASEKSKNSSDTFSFSLVY